MNILIYESATYGHRIEFVEYLNDYFLENDISDNITVLVHHFSLEHIFNRSIKFCNKPNIRFMPIEQEWQTKFDKEKNTLKRVTQESIYLKQILTKGNYDEIIFLEIDTYRLMVGFWAFSTLSKLSVKGIVFKQYIQEPFKLSNAGRYIRKLIQSFVLLTFKKLTIFILNDKKSIQKLNNIYGTRTKFVYLPDPIKKRTYNTINIKEKYNISESKEILLVVGGLQPRKNILNIIKSVDMLSAPLKKKTCLLIMGECYDSNYLIQINEAISKAQNTDIIFENAYITFDEMESALSIAKMVFLVYSDFYCSSGIIGNAAKHLKPVIACKNGVIGRITNEYQLGYTVDPQNVSEISHAIEKIMSTDELKQNDIFLEKHNHLNFVKTLLD